MAKSNESNNRHEPLDSPPVMISTETPTDPPRVEDAPDAAKASPPIQQDAPTA